MPYSSQRPTQHDENSFLLFLPSVYLFNLLDGFTVTVMVTFGTASDASSLNLSIETVKRTYKSCQAAGYS
jgi:hypothetical protein